MDIGQLVDAYIKPYTGEIIALAILAAFFYFVLNVYRRSQERRAERNSMVDRDRIATLQNEARQKREREQQFKEAEERRLVAIKRKEKQEQAKREEQEKQEAEANAAAQAEMDHLLSEWNQKMRLQETEEEAQDSTEQENQATEEAARIQDVDRSLAEWELEEMGIRPAQSARRQIQQRRVPSSNIRVIETKKKVSQLLEQVEREAEDLDYVINKLQTGVDFLPIQVQDTINKWKRGEVYRRNTLGDLKLKFRYQAYSIDDGLELLYMYGDWILKQRQLLYKCINLLGTKTDETEDDLLEAVARAEETQWARSLEIDMDILESLKMIRDIHQIMANMELRLRDLERVCKKRSDQIIAPQWEPKGTL